MYWTKPGWPKPAPRCGIGLALALLVSALPAPMAADSSTAVTVVRAAVAPIHEELPLPGTVIAPRLSRISAKVNGLVREIRVEAGDEVRAGDPLLDLDSRIAEIDLARARAQVIEAEARLKNTERLRREAEELLKEKHIARSAFDNAAAQVEVDAAVLQRLREELRRQQQLVEWHTVRAPFAGAIVRRVVEAGEWIETGDALFELAEIETLRIDVPVPQHYFSRVRLGTPATIRFDALPDHSFEAGVSIIVPMGQANTRTFPVQIDLRNPDRIVAPGMSARVFLKLTQPGRSEALLLPRDAIIRKPDGTASVWVVNDSHGRPIATPVIVRTGRSYRDHVEIVAGDLSVGDRVVVRGNEILREGETVLVKEETELNL